MSTRGEWDPTISTVHCTLYTHLYSVYAFVRANDAEKEKTSLLVKV